VPFDHNTVELVDLYVRLYREHEKIEGVQWHHTLIPPGEWKCANPAKSNVSIDCVFAKIDAISACPELPLDQLDHQHDRAADILRLCPLFGNESGCARMCLGVNGLALCLILPADLRLVQRFPHLPLWRREDISIDPTHRDNRSSRWVRHYCVKHRPCRHRRSCQGQQ
jgi:hypothetical protein